LGSQLTIGTETSIDAPTGVSMKHDYSAKLGMPAINCCE